mmetsp:Transcript_31735/g.47147  ORF Transcript_31735/g.47147 Transcript_31735/m.47147 type:complete len:140 (-) Transcript_31735:954-1373(-)
MFYLLTLKMRCESFIPHQQHAMRQGESQQSLETERCMHKNVVVLLRMAGPSVQGKTRGVILLLEKLIHHPIVWRNKTNNQTHATRSPSSQKLMTCHNNNRAHIILVGVGRSVGCCFCCVQSHTITKMDCSELKGKKEIR